MLRRLLTTLIASASFAGVLLANSPTQAATLPTPPIQSVQAVPSVPDRWIGFYQPGAPQRTRPLRAVENRLGIHIGVVNFYRCIEQGFTPTEVNNAAARGSIPLITLEFCAEGRSGVARQPAYRLARITRGDHDAKLRAYARAARNCGHEIWLRPFHEMNGYWYPWGGTVNGNRPSDFIPAWRHVHDIFTQEGATNVKFVWCPNVESQPNTRSNSIATYFPGSAYVDYLALDGYNFSTTLRGVRWRSFTSLFAAPYAQLCALPTTAPIFVAETASVSKGGSKVWWVKDMFNVIPRRFPRIIGVVWFNSGGGTRDWPIDSLASSLQAFRLGATNGEYSPGLKLKRVRPKLTLKARKTRLKRRQRLRLSGVLSPGQYRDRVRVEVKIPRSRKSHAYARTNYVGKWSFSYRVRRRGNYYVRATYAGDSTRAKEWTKTIKIRVR